MVMFLTRADARITARSDAIQLLRSVSDSAHTTTVDAVVCVIQYNGECCTKHSRTRHRGLCVDGNDKLIGHIFVVRRVDVDT